MNCSWVSPGLRVSRVTLLIMRAGSRLFVGVALDAVGVLPLDADEARRAIAARGVDVALVVDVSHAGLERVTPPDPHLARLVGGGPAQYLPVGHHRGALGLAVDRPGGAVIVRVRLLRAAVHVGEDAEPERGVLVEDFPLGNVVAEVLGDEGLVLEHVLDDGAHLLAPVRTGIGFENGATGRRELLEGIGHGDDPPADMLAFMGHAPRRGERGHDMAVSQLAYLGIGVSDLARWRTFASDVLGMQVVEGASDGGVY